jgi:hypothetical protein
MTKTARSRTSGELKNNQIIGWGKSLEQGIQLTSKPPQRIT